MHLRYTAWLVLALMTATLAGCNKFTATNQVISEPGPVAQSGAVAQSAPIAPSGPVAPSAPDPSYRNVIADHLRTTFKNYVTYELFEISEPRWVHAIQGWNWLVCVRFVDRGHRRSYALLFNGSTVVDGHYAYQTDNCGTQAYVVFEQMGGFGLPPLH